MVLLLGKWGLMAATASLFVHDQTALHERAMDNIQSALLSNSRIEIMLQQLWRLWNSWVLEPKEFDCN